MRRFILFPSFQFSSSKSQIQPQIQPQIQQPQNPPEERPVDRTFAEYIQKERLKKIDPEEADSMMAVLDAEAIKFLEENKNNPPLQPPENPIYNFYGKLVKPHPYTPIPNSDLYNFESIAPHSERYSHSPFIKLQSSLLAISFGSFFMIAYLFLVPTGKPSEIVTDFMKSIYLPPTHSLPRVTPSKDNIYAPNPNPNSSSKNKSPLTSSKKNPKNSKTKQQLSEISQELHSQQKISP